MQEAKDKENWVDLIKVFACILITNSHCREIYPWYFLAIGGGFGNALFFAVSGYLLANIRGNFGSWYVRRVKRIVPTVLFVALFDVVVLKNNGIFLAESLWDKMVYYPFKWWFVTAILIYYPVYYFVLKYELTGRAFLIWFIGYFVIYLGWMDKTVFQVELGGFSLFKVYFYFGIMLMGAILRKHKAKIAARISDRRSKAVIALIDTIAIAVWVMEYYAVFEMGRCYYLQFLIQMSVLVFAVMTVILSWDIRLRTNRIVTLISASTLEIYLTQTTVGILFAGYVFPLNWLLFFGTAFGGGIVCHGVIDALYHLTNRWVRKGQ